MKAYLALERAMVDLDDAGDPVGDELRNRMDPIWLMLSDGDRDSLDRRIGDPSLFAGTATLRSDLTVRRSVREHFRRAA